MSSNLQLEQSKEHIENHKAYVQSWIEEIREKPESLVKAVQQAEKVASYMEYKAELLTKEEYIKNVGSTMEVSETKVMMEENSQERKISEQKEKTMDEMMEKEIKEIKEMLAEIRDDVRFFRDFMQEYQIPEMRQETEQQKEQQVKDQKREPKELSLRI